jgi:hypothetical protein
MGEELTPQRNIHHETDPTEANLPAPFRDAFGRLSETPPREDPAFWPVKVLNELNYMILERDHATEGPNAWGVNPRELGERFAPYQEHIRKVKTAYETRNSTDMGCARSRSLLYGCFRSPQAGLGPWRLNIVATVS